LYNEEVYNMYSSPDIAKSRDSPVGI